MLPSSFLILVAVASVSAQRPATPPGQPAPNAQANVNLPISKMALIYSDAFLDPKTGITKFNGLLASLNREFQKPRDELTQIQKRSQQLQDEITKLQAAPAGTPIDQKSLQAKVDQLEQLKTEYQRKGEDAQTSFTRRRQEVLAPLEQDISKALEVFAKAHNINVIIDGARVPLLYAADSMDITTAFISEFNAKNPATASVTSPE